MDNAGLLDRSGRVFLRLLLFLGIAAMLRLPALARSNVTLTWDTNTSAAPYISGYTVRYGVVSHNYTKTNRVGNVASTTITNLVEGTTYFFAITAYDSSGMESVPSNEVSYSVPLPTLTLVTNGLGAITLTLSNSISPIDLSKTNLVIGRNYTVKAAPAAGRVFVGWNGSLTSAKTNLSFCFTSNLVLRANFFPSPLLTLITNGLGSITPNLTKSNLTLGTKYTLKAAPAAGQLFAGWTGSLTCSTTNLSFYFTSNLVLQANFIPNPFVVGKGSYYGLFYETNQVRQFSAGFFTAALTGLGTYSGRLQIGAASYLFSGKFNMQCLATNVIPRTGTNALVAELQLGTGSQANRISGRVTDGTWVAALAANRAMFNATTNPAPYAGSYTIIFPGTNGVPSLPTGDGFGTVKVGTGGLVSFAGVLADGKPGQLISQSVPLSRNGLWPLYVPLYSGKGSLLSWIAFTNRVTDDLSGRLNWIKLAMAPTNCYAAGFTNQIMAIGSRYVPPAGANRVLNFTNAYVTFSGGNLARDFTNRISLGPYSKVTNLSSNGLTLTFSLTAGKFSGSVINPANVKLLSFQGAVLQKLNAGCGYLLGTNQSSRVRLAP